MPGVSKPRYKHPFFRSGMNLSFTSSDNSRCPNGWFLSSLSSVQAVSDKGLPLNNFFFCLVPLIFTNPFTNWRYSPQQHAQSGSSSCQSISMVKKPVTTPSAADRFVCPPGISALFTQALYFELGQSALGDFVILINFRAVAMNPRASLSHLNPCPR